MTFFRRIYRTPDGLIAWCECGKCIEAQSALSLSAGIFMHLRRKHRKAIRPCFDEIASTVVGALRRAA